MYTPEIIKTGGALSFSYTPCLRDPEGNLWRSKAKFINYGMCKTFAGKWARRLNEGKKFKIEDFESATRF